MHLTLRAIYLLGYLYHPLKKLGFGPSIACFLKLLLKITHPKGVDNLSIGAIFNKKFFTKHNYVLKYN